MRLMTRVGRSSRSPGCKALAVVLWVVIASEISAQGRDRWQIEREKMVQESLIAAGIRNERVLESMRATPRHLFVARQLRHRAYSDAALPIGAQQTISSPFIVAFMTECLDPQVSDRVLEIGTGSGYQAAILSPLVTHVYTIEIVESLGIQARRTLRELRLTNVSVKIGDGFEGWPEFAPFDKIVVTCSPENVPPTLVDQLKDGGRMVIPVGQRYQQTMYLFRKENGELIQESLRPTLFVPMTGRAEAERDIQPDPSRPQLLNASFEEPANEAGFIPGWYYQRQAAQQSGADAPEGSRYVRFENATPGQDSHLMQGLGLDGRHVRRVRLGGSVKTDGVELHSPDQDGPRVVISFYDQNRRELGIRWLGPWRGNSAWQHVAKVIPVPGTTREAIVRIGLFGATGTASFDDLQLEAVP